jgi:hypothetical protein
MRFAEGTNALQIASGRWLEPSDFFVIKIKRSHSAQQQVRGFRAFPGQRAQFGSRHPYVSRHALDFRFVTTAEIRFGTLLEPSSTPRQHRFKRGSALSFLG